MKHRVKDLKKASARSQRSMASDNNVTNTELVSSERPICKGYLTTYDIKSFTSYTYMTVFLIDSIQLFIYTYI